MKCLVTGILAVCASVAGAEGFVCEGTSPSWTLDLDITAETGRFIFPAVTTMDLMLETRPKGQDWPRAFTLVGARDTAIVLIETEACEAAPFRAHVFTQRGQTPILLGGCCQARP